MAPIIPDQPLPRRTESGLSSRAINAAAGVLLAAMKQGTQTPTGLAIALDSACLLNSPETAAELERLRDQVAELKAERHTTNEALSDAAETLRANRDRIAELEQLLAAKDRPADEDPICFALTPKAEQLPAADDAPPRVRHLRELVDRQREQVEADGITRRFAPTQALMRQYPEVAK